MFTYKFGKITTVLSGLLGLNAILMINPAQAQILNGSFEDNPTELQNLTPWFQEGDVIKTDSSYGSGPTQGLLQALLTTVNLGESNAALNVSGNEPSFAFDIETSLDLSPGVLNLPNDPLNEAQEGSVIWQDFNGQVGDILSLNWNFLTNDTDFSDYAFIVFGLVSDLPSLTYSDLPKLSSTSLPLSPSNTPFAQETGFRSQTFSLSTTGLYRLGIGVVDVGDSESGSAVLVDNVQLTPQSENIPEPTSAIAILGLGLFSIAKKLVYRISGNHYNLNNRRD